MSRNLTRVPIIAMDYLQKDSSVAMELLVDYDNGKMYAKSKNGLSFIGFNTDSDNHIADDDIHVTLLQKTAWTQNIQDLSDAIILKAPLESPDFTGSPTVPTLTAADISTKIANAAMVQAAIAIGNVDKVDGRDVDDTKETSSYLWTAAKIKAYVDSLLASNDAMIFKGTLGVGGTITALPTTGYNAGESYKIITVGTYAGVNCGVGDMIICIKDYSTTFLNSDWTVTQTNLDGAVTGSSSSVVDGHIAIFDGATGKIIKTGGKALPAGNVVGDTSYGTAGTAGVVKSSASNNKVSIDAGGVMTVNLVDATKGGTGKTSVAINAMLYASAANVYSEVLSSVFGRSLLNATSGTVFAGLNSDYLDGSHLYGGAGLGAVWGYVPKVHTDGTMEIGSCVDFHAVTNDGIDYAYRLCALAGGELTGNGKFTTPEIKATSKFNINDKAFIQFNNTDNCIEFAFNN